MQTSVYFRHQKALPMTKIRTTAAPFASLNCLSSPSELRESDFEVGRQTSTSTNEKASFRQRARVLGREGFQTSRTDFSVLHVAWGLCSADHSSGDIIPSFFLLPDEQRRPFFFIDLDGWSSRNRVSRVLRVWVIASCRFNHQSVVAHNVVHTFRCLSQRERMEDERSASSAYYITIPGPS